MFPFHFLDQSENVFGINLNTEFVSKLINHFDRFSIEVP